MKIVISCGPTREPLDPVRFISNYSTGTLGTTLARVCLKRGHRVTLVHGPIEIPKDIRRRTKTYSFETVLDLMKVLSRVVPKCDAFFMVAAVSDFKPLEAAVAKIKKGSRFLRLSLVQNPDVLKHLGRYKDGKVYVGFSLESKNLYRNSLKKLREKNLDLMVAQLVTERIKPFGPRPIGAMVIDCRGGRREFRKVTKEALSRFLIRKAEDVAREKEV